VLHVSEKVLDVVSRVGMLEGLSDGVFGRSSGHSDDRLTSLFVGSTVGSESSSVGFLDQFLSVSVSFSKFVGLALGSLESAVGQLSRLHSFLDESSSLGSSLGLLRLHDGCLGDFDQLVGNFLGTVELDFSLQHGNMSDMGFTLSADCLSLEVSDPVARVSVADNLESLVGVSNLQCFSNSLGNVLLGHSDDGLMTAMLATMGGLHGFLNFMVGLLLGLSNDGVVLGSAKLLSSALLSELHVVHVM